jgi:hypothetical protein
MSEENQVEVTEGDAVVESVEQVDEASSSAETLKPAASKSSMMSDLMSKVAGMSKEDLSSFLDKTLAQVGKEADTVPDTSGKNKGSISNSGAGVPAPRVATPSKAAMKEDLQDLFSGSELSEDAQTQFATIFEAAINNHVSIIEAQMNEQVEQLVEEQVTTSVEALTEQVDQYMDYCVSNWMEANEVALHNNIKVDMTENFIEGMKNLFAESYVEMPNDKVDVVETLLGAVSELEEALELVEADNVLLTNLISEATLESAFDEVTEGLVQTQSEKLRQLSEGIEYASVDDYVEKLKIIKEQYFTESVKEEGHTGLINEEVSVGSNDDAEDAPSYVSEDVRQYVQAISNTNRK